MQICDPEFIPGKRIFVIILGFTLQRYQQADKKQDS